MMAEFWCSLQSYLKRKDAMINVVAKPLFVKKFRLVKRSSMKIGHIYDVFGIYAMG